jgi:argininosuccinate lyase
MTQLWGGRFSEDPDGGVMDYTRSFRFDVRILPYDLRGSIAHARMLGAVGLITPRESRTLVAALEEMLQESSSGIPTGAEAEDVHTYVENTLRRRIGELAGKLHTARSRNDQVALDMRLYLLDACDWTREALREALAALLDRAEEERETILPGFTHLQPAQPVLLAHHLLAYFEMFRRDLERFADVRRRTGESPLGAGALAGSSLPIDRHLVAQRLGFAGVCRNSLDAVSDRDFLVEFMAAASLAMAHLSRLAEEMVLWSSPMVGFISLPDRLATGSSMLPQKKNPDVAELIRGKTGRVYGNLLSLLTVLKGLPLSYNRDLQEDKEPVFDSVDTLLGSLGAAALYLRGMVFNREKMLREAAGDYTVATDVAEYLVRQGLPFRRAHEVVGRIVREAIVQGRSMGDLGLEEYQAFSPLFKEEVLPLLTPQGSVGNKQSFGSTGPAQVAGALLEARAYLGTLGGEA